MRNTRGCNGEELCMCLWLLEEASEIGVRDDATLGGCTDESVMGGGFSHREQRGLTSPAQGMLTSHSEKRL